MNVARDMFRQTVNILDDLRARQGNLGTNEQWAGEMAKCDTAFER